MHYYLLYSIREMDCATAFILHYVNTVLCAAMVVSPPPPFPQLVCTTDGDNIFTNKFGGRHS